MSFECFSIKDGLKYIDGIFFDGVKSGLKKDDFDLAFIYSDDIMNVSSVFTDNKFKASPILHYQKYTNGFQTNFLLVNSKNANAMNGQKGIDDIEDIFYFLKEKYPNIQNPIMSSTGVIGQRLDVEKIKSGINLFNLRNKNMSNFSSSILTTDKFEKTYSMRVEIGNDFFHISGVAKGAGMINPSMATMLCFIITDADIPKDDIANILEKTSDNTFNKISVDGDTSTNDTLMILTTNKKPYHKEAFEFSINEICKKLSLMILKDGEGSSKVVAFEVRNAKNEEEAKRASKLLSNSLLVKTAIFGKDPNWGRIASTIGASNIECCENTLSISYNETFVYKNGVNLFNEEVEKEAYKILNKDEFKIICDIGVGKSNYTSYGCDLGYEYVKINAEYRT